MTNPHDPMLCGLPGASCPACEAGFIRQERQRLSDRYSHVAAQLQLIAERFAQAERRKANAETLDDRNQAGFDAGNSAGEFWAASNDLAQLFVLLFRTAMEDETTVAIVRMHLAEALRPELTALVELIQGGGHYGPR